MSDFYKAITKLNGRD